MLEKKPSSKELLRLSYKLKPVYSYKKMTKLSRAIWALMGEKSIQTTMASTQELVETNNSWRGKLTNRVVDSYSTPSSTPKTSSKNVMQWLARTLDTAVCCAKAPASPSFVYSTRVTKVPFQKPSTARKTSPRCQSHPVSTISLRTAMLTSISR